MIKLFICDFDGTLTDGSLNDSYTINSKDALGFKILKDNNIFTGIITKSKNKINIPVLNDRLNFIINGVEDKLECLHEVMRMYNVGYDEICYIGDDIPDIVILSKIKHSFCPLDAHEDVKSVCKYICKKNGGWGAVREVCDYIMKYNERYNKKIVAFVGARSGSERCKNKNILDFNQYGNLIDNKLRILSDIDQIDKIIFSSDDDYYLDIASQYSKVFLDKRDIKYASKDTTGSEYFKYIASVLDDDDICIYAPVVTPFITKEDFIHGIETYKTNPHNNCVTTTATLKNFLWLNGKPLNYDFYKAPNSQNLPEIKRISFGYSIISKKDIVNYSNVIGNNPIFIDTDEIKSMDIDTEFDFVLCKLLSDNNINNISDISNIIKKREINVIDCTIRDGGYLNNWDFTIEDVCKTYHIISESGIEFFEIGFRSNKIKNKGIWFYSSPENILKIKKSYKGLTPSKICVMLKYGEYDIEDINNEHVDMYRLLISNKIDDSHNKFIIDSIKKCNEIGVDVCLNIPKAHVIDKNLETLFRLIQKENVNIDVIYLADTYGSMTDNNIILNFNIINEMLIRNGINCELGFHAHNNTGDALHKTIAAIKYIHNLTYVDSCLNGMGRGSGNTETEFLIPKLNDLLGYKYDINKLYKSIYDNGDIKNKKIVLYQLMAKFCMHPNNVDILINYDYDYILENLETLIIH